MSKVYAVVSVESETLDTVTHQLDQLFLGCFENEASKAWLGIFFDIEDRSEEIKYSVDFMRSEGLPNTFRYPDDIDILKFGIEVDIYTSSNAIGYDLVDIIGDSVAAHLSKVLMRRTMLRIGDIERPLFVYANGKRLYHFMDAYEDFYRKRNWCPRFDD